MEKRDEFTLPDGEQFVPYSFSHHQWLNMDMMIIYPSPTYNCLMVHSNKPTFNLHIAGQIYL